MSCALLLLNCSHRAAHDAGELPGVTHSRLAGGPDGATLEYAVAFDPDRGELSITARIGVGGRLHVHRQGRPYVRDLRAKAKSSDWTRIPTGHTLPEGGAVITYRFALDEAIDDLDGTYGTERSGDVRILSPTFWLIRPYDNESLTFHLDVVMPEGHAFAAGYATAGSALLLDSPAMAALGPIDVHRIDDGLGGDLSVVTTRGAYPIEETAIVDWSERSARSVFDYFEGTPTDGGLVLLLPCDEAAALHHGYAIGYSGGASIRVHVGRDTTTLDLARDWALTHELIHLGFPNLPQHPWIEEGLATYLEPLIRARNGRLSREEFWAEMTHGLENAVDHGGRVGFAPPLGWGDVYWGGALFFLRADVAIRRRSGGERTLDDALQAIHGVGDIRRTRDGRRMLEVGDRATGGRELVRLYDRLADQSEKFDLRGFLDQLGVSNRAGEVELDDDAPDADLRDALLASPLEP